MVPDGYAVKNLKDISWTKEIPEPFDTFEENAATKVSTLFAATQMICLLKTVESSLKHWVAVLVCFLQDIQVYMATTRKITARC